MPSFQYATKQKERIGTELESSLSRETLELIIQISEKRAAVLRQLKNALISENMAEVKRLAGIICGLPVNE
jgi:hypothetical protein